MNKEEFIIKSIEIHGIFEQIPKNHMNSHGCIKCANTEIRKKFLKRLEENINNGYQISPSFNSTFCDILDKMMEEKNIFIQHAMNGGEFYIKELGYWLDGYDKINNIAYEFDEKHHFVKGNLREKDVIRQEEIEKFLGCKFIRIKDETTTKSR